MQEIAVFVAHPIAAEGLLGPGIPMFQPIGLRGARSTARAFAVAIHGGNRVDGIFRPGEEFAHDPQAVRRLSGPLRGIERILPARLAFARRKGALPVVRAAVREAKGRLGPGNLEGEARKYAGPYPRAAKGECAGETGESGAQSKAAKRLEWRAHGAKRSAQSEAAKRLKWRAHGAKRSAQPRNTAPP